MLFLLLLSYTYIFITIIQIILFTSQYGVLAIIVYGGYMAYLSIYNISLSNFSANWDKVHLFPNDFSQVILVMGNFSLAFLSHNAITTMLANAKDQSKNTRNVSLGYLNVLSIYGLIGIFGAVGILNLDWEQDGIQTTVLYVDFICSTLFHFT
ncbi:hypothetical protein PPERSA_10563 [Pseudocohnilembus persalinus]|uniref:Amino acid transporter transmembrane domain-containing protein n=1 Tax=Pseudocohnilembus persalinus TaxID=266149 RepID=A0A0V0Q963_PSEPJ|nr:hypothetical protein PPERSA_10563 [Pseudocohnilembus persalinus]|eukprot:KRW98792.1 hypothetical protein PPERSA_10563 [Pseudocohnilembus persalinus]